MSDGNLTSGDPLAGDGAGEPGLHPSGLPNPHPQPQADSQPQPHPQPAGYAAGPRPPGAMGQGAFAPPAPVGLPPSGPAPTFTGQLQLAGWWRRVGAACIDGLIIGIVALIFIVPLGIGAVGAESDGGFVAVAIGFILAALVISVVALVYAPVMMVKTNGQTVGRMATGIRVVRTNGQSMDYGTAIIREVVFKFVLIGAIANGFTFGLASLLDVLWPLWDEENRALHDFPVNTRTVLG